MITEEEYQKKKELIGKAFSSDVIGSLTIGDAMLLSKWIEQVEEYEKQQNGGVK